MAGHNREIIPGHRRSQLYITAAVEYRLAPEHPFPIPLEDCYTALKWLAGLPEVDCAGVAIGGESAGGGLAAALALLAKERGAIRPLIQVLSHPMIDDRTAARTDVDPASLRTWGPASNRFGWSAYLGPAAADVPPGGRVAGRDPVPTLGRYLPRAMARAPLRVSPAVAPPSQRMSVPVRYPGRSPAQKARTSATSSGRP